MFLRPILSHGIFQSTPPARGATYRLFDGSGYQYISIHAPREGGDLPAERDTRPTTTNFNPRPPRGGRRNSTKGRNANTKFQSTPPARGATLCFAPGSRYFLISIHAPREGGDVFMAVLLTSLGISIHAPREGGDMISCFDLFFDIIISIHAPREGGDSVW